MNKKELGEIKKHFNENDSLFTLNSIVNAYVDAEKNIKATSISPYHEIPEEESSVMFETLGKILKGSLGKALLEYSFPSEQYEEDGTQKLLYSVLADKLQSEEIIEKMVSQIVNNFAYEPAYSVIIGHFTYSAFSRDKNDVDTDDTFNYNFLVAAICPASTANDGLMFNSETGAIVKKKNWEMIISREPTDGFLFPTFTDRNPDVNSVLYFTKTAKKPNITFVNDVLGCKFLMSATGEKVAFKDLVSDVVGEELDYTVVTQLYDLIEEVVTESKNEPDLPIIDGTKICSMLTEIGVSEEKLEALPEIYKERLGDNGFKATNLTLPKTTLQTPDVKIIVGKNATDKVRTTVIEGRKCLIIDLEDPSIEINGLDAKIY